jgi:hypothetical protein
MPEFTPTESRIIKLLSDGLPHKKKEIHECLYDDMGRLNNIQQRISMIRKKLRPIGQDIICELIGYSIQYRHVRLLRSNNE